MKNLTFLSNFWRKVSAKVHGQDIGLGLRPQCSDVSLDRRLTVGSPSVQYASTTSARTTREWLKPVAVSLLLFTFAVGQMWGATTTLAGWTFTSSSYPSNKTNFTATTGTMTSSSTFYLNGSGSTWNSTKGYAFTAVTDITITLTLNQAVPKGTVFTLSAATFYNKASNAPMTGFTIKAKEGTGSYATTGVGTTSWSLSTSSATKTTTYTTQAALASGTAIAFQLTGTGKAGSGQGYMNNITITATTYSVTYNGNSPTSGSVPTDNVKYITGGTVTVKANSGSLTKSGYTFSGWNTNTSGTGTNYTAGSGTFTITADKTLYAKWDAAATTVSLTKAGQNNGSFTLTQSSTAVTSVTTTSAAQAVTVTATPSAGYYLSNLTASNPTTGTASVTGSGNTRTVTYTKGANGSSTITATFSPIWYLKGDFNSWGTTDPLTNITSNVATVTKSLSKTTAYEFKVYNAQEDAWYGNNGKIIDDISGWTFSTSEGNCKVFATVADDYTFKYNISTKAMQVEYPDMTHPNDAYVYLTEWWDCYVHYWYTDGEGDHALVNWGYDTQLSRDVEICGTDYWCVPILDGYPKLIMKDNAGDPSNTTGDQTTASNAGKYITHNGSAWVWNTFSTYTITFAGNGNTGGSMSDVNGICPGGSEALPANAFTKTGYTFANWQTDVAVTANSSAVSAGGTVPAGATLSSIGSNITLTAQWTANTITLNLKKNNSDASGSSDGSATIKYDATAKTSITAATRTGYTVEGYYTDAACTAANKVLTDAGAVVSGTVSGYTTSGKWTRATTPTDLYTKWTAKSCTVTFDKNSGTGGSNSVTATYGSAMPDITPPTRSGYIFGGYYDSETSDNGTGTQYYKADGKSAKNWDKNVTSGQTLYARWYGDPIAWCDPDITITGDIHLTSYKDIYVQSTTGAGNLVNISSNDLGSATTMEIAYLNGSDAEVAKASSVFRLCNSSTYAAIDASSSTIDVSSDDTWDVDYSIKYQPNAFAQLDNYKLQVKLFNGDSVIKTVTHNLYGRSLPQEFVIASKHNGEWFALPNTMGTSLETVTPIKITVDNTTTPTAAAYAPTTTVYKGAARYRQTSNVNSIRLTSTGSNWLETGSTAQLSLSTTAAPTEAVENKQVWYLKSSNFGAYTLKMDPAQSPTKQLGMSGSHMGMYESPTSPSGEIYLLPITNKYTEIPATVTEWGQNSVIVAANPGATATKAKAHVEAGTPTADQTITAINAAMGTAKNIKVPVGSINLADLTNNEGKLLYIEWYNSSSVLLGISRLTIPRIIAASRNMYKTGETTKGPWATEVHVLPGVTLTANTASYSPSGATINELHVYPGATLDVTTGTLTTTTLRLHNGWTRAGEKQYNVARVYINAANDAALVKTTASIDYDIYEQSDGKHYYPMAVPFTTPVSSIDYADSWLAGYSNYGASGQYVIKTYDGASRAESGGDNNWAVVADDKSLKPGVGYIITAVAVKGEAIIRIPLTFDNNWTADGEKNSISASYRKDTTTVVAYTGTAASTNDRHKGWNMLGVPYMSCFGGDDDLYSGGTASLINGTIMVTPGEEDPYSYGGNQVPYVSVPSHDFAEYIQTELAEADLRPGWSFFIQANTTGLLTFAASHQQTDDETPPYAPRREEEPEMRTGIILSSADASDKTTFIVSDKYTSEYEIDADLEKMFGNGYTLATYSLMNDTRLAYNAMSTTDAQQVIPIGFRAPKDGEYTFSINPRYSNEAMERVDLIDYQTGTLTNLLYEDYTFTTGRTQDDNRFALNVKPSPRVPTSAETGEVGNVDLKMEKVIIDDKMYIIYDKRMYDVTGKRVYNINK